MDIVEKLNQIRIIRFADKVAIQKNIHDTWQKESVIYGQVSNFVNEVPACSSSPRFRVVDDIARN